MPTASISLTIREPKRWTGDIRGISRIVFEDEVLRATILRAGFCTLGAFAILWVGAEATSAQQQVGSASKSPRDGLKKPIQ
jgi:hypothetical protein